MCIRDSSDPHQRGYSLLEVWRTFTGRKHTGPEAVSYTHLRAHETPEHLVCRLLLEKKKKNFFFFFLMIRRPPRSTLDRSSAASDVYKRQLFVGSVAHIHWAQAHRTR